MKIRQGCVLAQILIMAFMVILCMNWTGASANTMKVQASQLGRHLSSDLAYADKEAYILLRQAWVELAARNGGEILAPRTRSELQELKKYRIKLLRSKLPSLLSAIQRIERTANTGQNNSCGEIQKAWKKIHAESMLAATAIDNLKAYSHEPELCSDEDIGSRFVDEYGTYGKHATTLKDAVLAMLLARTPEMFPKSDDQRSKK